MISVNKNISLKSVTTLEGNIDDFIFLLGNLDIKTKYDDTFELGYYIEKFPLEVSTVYYKYKKILMVSPRDMILLSKIQRVRTISA